MGESEAQRPLYARLMKAIDVQHTWGNRVGFVKLPLIMLDIRLYGGAIAQFYMVTEALEAQLARHADHELVAHVREAIALPDLAPGYAADLRQIFGDGAWPAPTAATDEYVAALRNADPVELVAHVRRAIDLKDLAPGYAADLRQIFGDGAWPAATAATEEYLKALRRAGPVEVVAALFILYGALVVGGGKQTQSKVKRLLPGCDHVLFDVSEDMRAARRRFKNAFTSIGKDHAGVAAVAPECADDLVRYASLYMRRNNAVVLSARVTPAWFWPAVTVGAVAAFVVARRRR